MGISIKQLRELGFLKIMQDELHISAIFSYNMQYLNVEAKAWSFLPNYQIFGSKYHGMDRLVKSMNLDIDMVDETDKRNFRNIWASIWHSFASSTGIDNSTQILLSEFGLRLAFIQSDDKTIRDVARFYDDVIDWYLYTKQGTSSLPVGDILKTLVVGDASQLRRYWKE